MDTRKSYPLYTGQQVKIGEVKAAKLAKVPMYELMQRAGFATYQLFTRYYGSSKHLLVVCGSGNNGGDGYVVALFAKQAGYSVTVISTCERDKLIGDARRAMQEWVTSGGTIHELPSIQQTFLDDVLEQCDAVVDGILGTGLSGAVRKPIQRLIDTVNEYKKPVIAIDIPSGLCSDTGCILGASISAAHTITFIGLKQGLVTGKAREVVGQLHYAGLDVECEFNSLEESGVETLSLTNLLSQLPQRKPTAHKGSHGRLVCIGGNAGFSGAISMCSTAAARSGAGLITALTHPSSILPLQVSTPEVMAFGIESNTDEVTEDKLVTADSIAMGPGLGSNNWAFKLYHGALASNKPVVMDADALNILAQQPSYRNNRILTPHPGEAARLLACSVEQIESDRYRAVRDLQKLYGGVVILKGAGTLVCDGAKTYVCLAGNPGMASGGMGDVLTGVIAALVAQGLDLGLAARLGVVVHSEAADREAEEHGQVGLLASDLIAQIRAILNRR